MIKIATLLTVFFTLVGSQLMAGEVQVIASQAQLYNAPNGKSVGSIAHGKKIRTEDEESDGFLKLKTKSGNAVWIRESDVRVIASKVEEDLDTSEEHEAPYSKFTWDLGFSTGSSGGVSYSEADVGLNYFLKHWLAWRNAVFGRFVSPENIYGLDTSARLFYTLGLGERSSVTIFGGPGYRFVTKGINVPFAEGGVVTHLGGFSIGGGAKTFFTQMVQPGASPDTLYFLIISGGGAF
jgi:hypothetical protein